MITTNNRLLAAGGAGILALGIFGAIAPGHIGPAWFACAAVAATPLAIATFGAGRAAAGSVRLALLAAAAGLVGFVLAHVYAVFDADHAIPVFSAVLVVIAAALIVAGVLLLRGGAGRRGGLTLLGGAWPIATIPAGAALGDVPHFLAIAGWGACWIALGLLASAPVRRVAVAA